MRPIFIFKMIVCLATIVIVHNQANCQQRINKKELELLKKNLATHPLLQEGDNDFKSNSGASRWNSESAVILCKKTSFEFDKKGMSVGKRIGRNVWAAVFAIPTLGTSFILANANNETKILIEETERCKILVNDKSGVEQYAVLYFRLSAEGDAFAARVIKKDGSTQPVDLSNSARVDDIKSVPSLFRSYTDNKFTTTYRPEYFKIAVPDLEEGDVVEYEFTNFNNSEYASNPNYKEFDPVYYLCNRSLPVSKQIIEIITRDDKYYIGYKNLKGAPAFTQSTNKDAKIYRWVDGDRDKMPDTRFVNAFREMPSIKFQVVYARNNSRSFVWFKDENDMNREISTEELSTKAKTFWFEPGKMQSGGDYTAGLKTDISGTVKSIYKTLKKKGITDGSDDDYIRKAYYYVRSQTLYHSWSDFAYAKVFSGLLEEKKISHEIVVSAPNEETNLADIAFTQEIAWVIKYKNKYYCNPGEHLNPEEIPAELSGNSAIRFSDDYQKAPAVTEILPLRDTTENIVATQIRATLNIDTSLTIAIEKNVEAGGLAKDGLIDDALSFTPYMENDYKNYDGTGMWEGLSNAQEEKATNDFADLKKEWKEDKPKMMKDIAENEYGYTVEKYGNFHIVQDGRAYKKKTLKYSESFVLADLAATAGDDKIIAIPALIGKQSRIKKEELTRTLPIDARYPRTLNWNIVFTLPAGYTAKGLSSLNKNISNDCGSFVSTAKIENNNLVIDVRKTYKAKYFKVDQWSRLVEVLDAAFDFSQARIILQKQ